MGTGARILIVMMVLPACGRFGFEPAEQLAEGRDADGDSGSDAAPCTFGAFGAPVRVTEISSAADDDWSPTVTGDELMIFLASWRSGASEIWQATRSDRASAFGTPEMLPEIRSGLDYMPGAAFDGLTLIVTSLRIGGMGSYDLWSATRADRASPFAPAVNLTELNSASFDAKPWLSPDGLRIYFESHRAGTADIYFAERASPGTPFGAPVPISELNTAAADGGPSLSPDELEVYFGSTRAGGLGRSDIWFARRTDPTLPFGPPERLTIVNTAFDDVNPWLSADGTTLYHNRDADLQGGRNADVWIARRPCTP